MAKIFPFRGITYNKARIKDYSLILTQPYDKITEAMQAAYYRKHKYNHIRITKPKKYPTDTRWNNIYTRAGACFRRWLKEGILKQDIKPTIYIYYQVYEIEGVTRTRKGFIALGRLVGFGKGGVHPHERTLLAPKQDRLKMMRAVGGSTGQIFMLYSDPRLRINQLMDKIAQRDKPDIIARDEYGVIHKVWKIQRPSLIKQICRLMAKKEVFIADGHHRYETALNYRDEMRALTRSGRGQARGIKCLEPESYNNRMMTFINMDDTEGLTILPTHRLVYGLPGFSFGRFRMKLTKYFDIRTYPTDTSGRMDFLDDLKIAGYWKHSFGLVVKGINQYFLLTLRDEKVMDKVVKEKHSQAWKRLDVSILHTLILDKMLGIGKEKLEREQNIRYARSADEVINSVQGGKYQLGFLLNPTKISEVKLIAGQGERMPQKSTDFFPKLLSGIVISKIDYRN